jgi:pyruvate kinase
VVETIAELVCHASRTLDMKLMAVFSCNGFTAQLISGYRPTVPIIAFAPET